MGLLAKEGRGQRAMTDIAGGTLGGDFGLSACLKFSLTRMLGEVG